MLSIRRRKKTIFIINIKFYSCKLKIDLSCFRYFASQQLSITSILAKHARALIENGQRVYVSKHGN